VRLALVLSVVLQTGACGLKGDLYLPDEQTAQPPPPAPTESPADAEGDDESGDDSDATAGDE